MTEIGGWKFYFSTPFYQGKFCDRISGFVESQTVKLYSQYKTYILVEGLERFFAVALYQQIEKRGCRILDEKGEELNVAYN